MKKVNYLTISLLAVLLSVNNSFADSALTNIWNSNQVNVVTPNCYLRKEFNYFTLQWTTNEVCNPSVRVVDLGSTNNYAPSYSAPTYSAPTYSAPTYNYSQPSYNTGGGYYFNGAQYLLSAFGGGYNNNSGSNNSGSGYSTGAGDAFNYYVPSVYSRYDNRPDFYNGTDYARYQSDNYNYNGNGNYNYNNNYDGYDGEYLDTYTSRDRNGNTNTYCPDCDINDLQDLSRSSGY